MKQSRPCGFPHRDGPPTPGQELRNSRRDLKDLLDHKARRTTIGIGTDKIRLPHVERESIAMPIRVALATRV
jgi:hypothetical protein